MSDEVKVPPQVAQKYRELGVEEPPRALDDAILAAARRPPAGERRPARSWTQRWAVPLSLAAVVVLSVTLTLRIQHEQPGIESPAPRAKESAPASPAPVADAQVKPKLEAQPKAAAAPTPAPAAVEMLASRRDATRSAESSAAGAVARNEARPAMAQMQAPAAKTALADTPERELERIAGLRNLGMHDEADKALAEFRKHYPDYAIPETMRARVERR